MSVETPPSPNDVSDTRRNQTRLILDWLKDYVGPILLAVSLVPLVCIFLSYNVARGAASYFGIPPELVKPDPSRVYDVIFYAVPATLGIIFAIVGTIGTSSPRQPIKPDATPLLTRFVIAIGFRALVSVLGGGGMYLYFRSVQQTGDIPKGIAVTSLVLFVFSMLPLLISLIFRLIRGKELFSEEASRMLVIGTVLAIAATCVYLSGLAYSAGKSAAASDTVHFILPGIEPEVVVLAAYDGYVTAKIDLPSCSRGGCLIAPAFRYREWKDHRIKYETVTGSLHLKNPVMPNDSRLRTKDPEDVEESEAR